ncbi:P-loop containing nucleoside triphosphate hydrolase protein [Hymenopellis radicata]|nr:P-loop containing nucleoside triphosphate hydrolase protein [Hymenopellis radicata]
MDLVYTNVLYAWAGSPIAHAHTQTQAVFPASVLEQMTALSTAVAAPTPSFYLGARTLKRRFILHVGPTNSGKTHAALRALAAAPSGVYAGPLRLLAHEIWERLNMGSIVPKGVDESQIRDEEVAGEEDTNLDTSGKAIIKTGLGRQKWVRETNMITGEEIKSVSPFAQHISCTVEMLNFGVVYDVGVIDEIQLLSDPERGFAWTAAVLGLNAAEIHLCGEATAIPLIRALVESCGDSLEIHEYTRLSPLIVEDQSLEHDLGRIQAGDCIVAFSRSQIFRFKSELEAKGLRVATIYGRLPPEVRSEQADRFNTGKADVLVGSDALGLGLNLKIRRMIFSQMAKVHSGGYGRLQPLSVSQVKQIAGRAGRYGLHSPAPTPKAGDTPSDNTPSQPTSTVGAVTTVYPGDLAFLRRTMELTPPPLSTAKVNPSIESVQAALRIISKASVKYTLPLIFNAHRYAARCPSHLRYSGFERNDANWEAVISFMDSQGLGLDKVPLEVTMLSLAAPLPIRDLQSHLYIRSLFSRLVTDLVVPVEAVLQDGLGGPYGYAEYLQATEVALGFPNVSSDANILLPTARDLLSIMETMHSCLSLYSWMHYRRPTSFPDLTRVQEDLLPRTRNTIDSILAGGLVKNRRASDHGVYGEKEQKVKYQQNVYMKGLQLDMRDKMYSGLRENIKRKQQQH